MGTVTLPNQNQTGDNEWSDVEENDQAIIDEVNGNLDSDNLAANAVGTTQIANSAVTTDKINDGAVTDAKMGLTTHQDTQSASISASGALTGISLTPGAGTYLAIATANLTKTSGTRVGADLQIRVNGSGVPVASVVYTTEKTMAVNMGVITPTAGQAVDVLATLDTGTGAGSVADGRLVLIRIA